MGKSDEVRRLLDQLREQGWRVEGGDTGIGGKGARHWKCFSPDGKSIVVLPFTASDHRSLQNARAQLRRAGFRHVGKGKGKGK